MSSKNYTAVFLCIIMFYVFGDIYNLTKLTIVKILDEQKKEKEREEYRLFKEENDKRIDSINKVFEKNYKLK